MPYTPTIAVCERRTRATVVVELHASATIADLKAEASDSFGRPIRNVTFAGQQLEDGRTLSEYLIHDGDSLYCNFSPQLWRQLQRRAASHQTGSASSPQASSHQTSSA